MEFDPKRRVLLLGLGAVILDTKCTPFSNPDEERERERLAFEIKKAELEATAKAAVEATPVEQKLHAANHYPTIEGQRIPAVPYLSLPIEKADIARHEITEGWIYTDEERKIHGFSDHRAVDIHLPYGSPVIAPVSGFAMSSYHNALIQPEGRPPRTYQGELVLFGLGYFVQIYVPREVAPPFGRFVQLAHLSQIDAYIPFSQPNQRGDNWDPTNHQVPASQIEGHPKFVWVEKGQPIGKIGFSGLALGIQKEYEPGSPRPSEFEVKSWDEPHIHLEEFWRDRDGNKVARRDPYAIYETAENYPSSTRQKPLGKDPLFLQG